MKGKIKFLFILFLVTVIFLLAISVSHNIADNAILQKIVAEFGYLGVLLVSIVAGLNTFVPLPAATFAPIFLSAGLSIYIIIGVMTIGTLIADGIGFALGHASREIIKDKHPRTFEYLYDQQRQNQKLVTPLIIAYAAFVPFPNEVLLIPLALAGARFRSFIFPLIIGNLIHQTLLVYGVTNVFKLLF